MAKNQQYRPFRIGLDLWAARVGSVVAWPWAVFWALIGLMGVGSLLSGQAADVTEKILPFFSLGLAALHGFIIKACRKTKQLVRSFRLYCSVFAREPDKSIQEAANVLKEPVENVLADIKEMCKRGYFNGFVDHRDMRMVFPDFHPQSQGSSALRVIQCPGCGAVNAIAKTGDACKYCGAPLSIHETNAG